MSSEETVTTGNLGDSARFIIGLLYIAESLGVSRAALLGVFRTVGLPPSAIDQPDYPIAPMQELAACSAIMNRQRPTRSAVQLGLEIAENVDFSRYGLIAFVASHAPNMLEGIKITYQYPQLAWGQCRQTLRIADQTTTITVNMEQPKLSGIAAVDINELVTMHITATVFIAAKVNFDVTGHLAVPSRIELPFPKPPDWRDTEIIVGAPIIFDCERAAIVYDFDAKDIVSPRRSAHFFKLYQNQAEALARALQEETSVLERVRQFLWAYNPPPSQSVIANYMGITERSLARKLEKAGTSYKALYSSVLTERSQNMLRQRQMTVAQISEKLGYSDPSAFSRAFSAWTGMSPKQWRENQ